MKKATFNPTKKILASASMLLVSSLMLSSATYAWFTMNKTVTVDGNTCYIALHLDGYVKGDVNADGIIDSNDASLVLEEYALASTGEAGKFGEREKMAGDINADGIIGSDDASSILAYYAASSTGGTPTWD